MKLKPVDRLVVDRIINGKAVVVNSRRKQTVVPLKKLPSGLREGDVLINGQLSRTETGRTKKRVGDLLSQILGKKKPASGR